MENILGILEEHSTLKKNEPVKVYKCFIRKQQMDEPFELYYAPLKKLISRDSRVNLVGRKKSYCRHTSLSASTQEAPRNVY